MNFFKIKSVALITLFFFCVSTIVPYSAAAFHLAPWEADGQPLNGSGSPAAGPVGPEKNFPPNNPPPLAEPVYIHSGEFFYEGTDLFIPGRGMDVVIKHLYRGGKQYNSQFGFGWTMNYYYRLQTTADGNVYLVSGDGRNDKFTFDSVTGTYLPPPGIFNVIAQNADGTWVLTQPNGTKINFDIEQRVSSIVDRNNNQISFAYNPSGLQPVVGQPTFARLGSLQTDAVLDYDYQLIRITDTVGRVINFQYNAKGLLSSITDYAGRTVTFNYDPANNLVSITKPPTAQFPTGVTRTFFYDSKHLITGISDAKGQTFVTNHYDTQGRVIQQDYGQGSYFFNYGLNQTTVTDRKGFVARYTFNATGNITTKEEFTSGVRPGDPGSFITTYTYNTDMLLTSVTYPGGNGIKYTYDSANSDRRARGNLLSVRRKASMGAADNNTADLVTTMTYESKFNAPLTVIDPLGKVTTFMYDYQLPATDLRYAQNGNLVTITQPVVGTAPKTDLTYNINGQPIKVVDPNNNVTNYSYHPATGYLQSIARAPTGINAITQFTFDVYGNPDTVTSPTGRVTNFDYNELGWLIQVTNPLGFRAQYTYDANGNAVQIRRQANTAATQWQTTLLAYDILNNLTSVTDPLNRVTTYTYDPNENLVAMTDPLNRKTSYSFDERNLLFKVTDANVPAGVTQHDYDSNGILKRIVDANGNATAYAYDGFDRLLTKTYANASAETYTYDKNNNVTQIKRPDLAVINMAYDALNRVTSRTYPANTGLNVTFTYDIGSRLKTANTAASKITYVYDALNRVTSQTQTLNAKAYKVSYVYDKSDNMTRTTYPSAKVVNYTYDANSRMTAVKLGTVNLATYGYDTLDRRARKNLISGTLTRQATYAYDSANQLLDINNRLLPSTTVSRYTYLYDNAGNRTRLTALSGVHNYAYNNLYELTAVTGAQTRNYAYDAVGNRITADGTSYVKNTLNQYTQVGPTALIYTTNGNLANDGPNGYTYDEENRLIGVTKGTTNASYTYDAFNRRVSKTVNGVTKYFVYDGDDIIAEYDPAGVLLAEYVHGSGTDEVLTMSRNGATYYYHHDGLGSVTEVTNAAGSIVESYTYDVYGQPSVTNSLIGNPYRFTGREYDEESGIYHYRARAYSPNIGRFPQRDPLEYYDSMNLYKYAHNNPVNYIDPSGELGIIIPVIPIAWWWIGGGLLWWWWMSRNGLNWGKPYPPLRPANDQPYRGPNYGNPRNPLDPKQKPPLPWWMYPGLLGPGFGFASVYCKFHPDTPLCKALNPDDKDKDKEKDKEEDEQKEDCS